MKDCLSEDDHSDMLFKTSSVDMRLAHLHDELRIVL